MASVRLYFHPRSPYSRIGLHHIAKSGLAERCDLSVHVFTAPAGGAEFLNPTSSRPKFAYIMEDAPRMTMRAGLPIAPPLRPEPDYTLAIAAFYAARERGKALEMAIAISDARWGRSQDIGDEDVLKACADSIDLPDLTFESPSADDIEKDREQIEADGVFGVPFGAFGDAGERTQKFWGHERFDLLIETVG